MKEIQLKNVKFRKVDTNNQDYICISDISYNYATDKMGADDLIKGWLRNKNTLEFLAVWEKVNNINFNYGEFAVIKSEAGVNRFNISIKQWAKRTNAIGIFAKTGRYGSGTFAHYDIALEFAGWLSPELKFYIIKEFQRLKQIEAERLTLEWKTSRFLSKINYKLQTNAIKNVLYSKLNEAEKPYIYANEADLINYALFGMTAKQWKTNNASSNKGENMRDYASPVELVILSNLEHKNSELIKAHISQEQRLKILIRQANEEKRILNSTEDISTSTE